MTGLIIKHALNERKNELYESPVLHRISVPERQP
jgi:hypothetical protein